MATTHVDLRPKGDQPVDLTHALPLHNGTTLPRKLILLDVYNVTLRV